MHGEPRAQTPVRSFLDALLPGTCPGCGTRGAAVCAGCLASLPPAGAGPCPAGLAGLGAALAYQGLARELVAGVKYRNHRSVVPLLADLAAQAAGVVMAPAHPPGRAGPSVRPAPGPGLTVVTWAPTTPARCRARGFDHAELLARGVARHLGLPARRLLTRRSGPAQTGRSAAERWASPGFVASGRARGHSVLVVDDVLTTGATLAAAAAALTGAGASRVFGTVVARTP